jgi:hypothetical protein
MSINTTTSIDNTQLNADISKVSCHKEGGVNGHVWSGIYYKRDNNDIPKITKSKCSGGMVVDNLHTYKRRDQLNNTCNCKMVNGNDSKIKCPSNSFIRGYYPLLNQAMCCSPCTSGNDLKLIPSENCEKKNIPKNRLSATCPNQTLMVGLELNKNGGTIECCKVKSDGEAVDKHNALQARCDELGTEFCTPEKVKFLEEKCAEYGLENCSEAGIQEAEKKCSELGLRFKDSTGKHQNTDSTMVCHNSNFDKLKADCDQAGLKKCSVGSLQKHVEDKMDKVENQEEVMSELKDKIGTLNTRVNKEVTDLENFRFYLIIAITVAVIIAYILIIYLFRTRT